MIDWLFIVANEVSDPISNTINFLNLKVYTMTSFPINLIPITGGESGGDRVVSSKSEEQQTPPRQYLFFKSAVVSVAADHFCCSPRDPHHPFTTTRYPQPDPPSGIEIKLMGNEVIVHNLGLRKSKEFRIGALTLFATIIVIQIWTCCNQNWRSQWKQNIITNNTDVWDSFSDNWGQ